MSYITESAKIKNSSISDNCRVFNGCLIIDSIIGNNTSIGDNSIIKSSGIQSHVEIERRNIVRNSKIDSFSYTGADTSIMWCSIGKFCSISRMVDIGGNSHDYTCISTMRTYKFSQLLSGEYVNHPDEVLLSIGNDVWIGQGACVLRKEGLFVGNGAVIGAHAVVTKSVPAYAIVVGVPARIIGYRFSERQIVLLEEISWWDWPISAIKENWSTISSPLTDNSIAILASLRKKMNG